MQLKGITLKYDMKHQAYIKPKESWYLNRQSILKGKPLLKIN